MIKSFSKEEIIELSNNSEAFKAAIIESKGFILYLADKYSVELTPQLLMDSICNYSIRFMTQHMVLHQYTPEQTAQVMSYLKEDAQDEYEEEEKNHYSLEELLQDLREDNDLPSNVDKLVKLSFDDFLNHSNELATLAYRSRGDYGTDDHFYGSHSLLEPLFKKISKEDFFKIDEATLVKCPALFAMAKHLMTEPEVKDQFNKVVQAFYNHPERKRSGYNPRLENYRHYPFDADEKELFISLLKNDYSSDYERIKRYKGFNDLFTKNEYILNHNISGIRYLSKKEISSHLPAIRKGIRAAYFKPHYQDFEKIYYLKIAPESRAEIFTPEFVKELIVLSKGFHFHYFDRDNQAKSDSINYLHKIVHQLCAQDDEVLNLVGSQNALNNLVGVMKNDRQYFDQDYANAGRSILERFEFAMKTPRLFANMADNYMDCYFEFDVPKLIVSNMQGKESINYAFFLMKCVQDKKQSWMNKTYSEELQRVIPLLNQDEVKVIAKITGYKVDKKLLVSHPSQDYESNFLNFTPEIIKAMDVETFKNIFVISKDFRKMVIQKDLDYILIDEKLSNQYQSLLSQVLTSITNNKSDGYDFMKSFIKKNREFMLEHYSTALITHPAREILIKLDTKEVEQDSYQKLEVILDKFSTISLEHERLSVLRDKFAKKERKECDKKITSLNMEKQALEKEVDSCIANMSFEFYKEKINSSDMLRAIELYNVNSKGFKDVVFDKVQTLTFEETKGLLDNSMFLNFIYVHKPNYSYSSSEARYVCFNPSFTNEQNIEIVETLLKNLNNKELFVQRYDSKADLSDVLSLIEQQRRFEISNELVIKHDPVNMFCSYDYLPEQSVTLSSFSRHVNHHFTPGQIIQAIDNLNAQGKKIICVKNQNLNHDNLLTHNYRYTQRDGKNPCLPEYLGLLKHLENDPINYLACIHSDIMENFTNKDNFDYLDIAKSDAYNKYVNIDVVVQAMKEVFAIYKEANQTPHYLREDIFKGIAVDNALKAVANFIHFTYYSDREEVISEFDKDKSQRILNTILEEAPYMFFTLSYIGKLGSLEKEVLTNLHQYYSPQMIENFFCASGKTDIVEDSVSFTYEQRDNSWKSRRAHLFLTGLVNHMTQIQDVENLYKLDFMLKEEAFNEERPYGKKVHDFSTPLTELMCHDEYKKLIEASLLFIHMSKIIEPIEKTSRTRTSKI